jgi:hypothetical protein
MTLNRHEMSAQYFNACDNGWTPMNAMIALGSGATLE